MRSHSHSSLAKRFFESRLFLVSVVVILAIVALSYARAYYQNYKVQQEIRDLEEQVSQLEKKRLESLEILDYVQSELFVEDVARTELNLKKPGEHVLVIHNPDAERKPGRRLTDAGQQLSNPVKWWYYFTNPDAVLTAE